MSNCTCGHDTEWHISVGVGIDALAAFEQAARSGKTVYEAYQIAHNVAHERLDELAGECESTEPWQAQLVGAANLGDMSPLAATLTLRAIHGAYWDEEAGEAVDRIRDYCDETPMLTPKQLSDVHVLLRHARLMGLAS